MGFLELIFMRNEIWKGVWCWWVIGQINRWIKDKSLFFCNCVGCESINVLIQVFFFFYIKDGE